MALEAVVIVEEVRNRPCTPSSLVPALDNATDGEAGAIVQCETRPVLIFVAVAAADSDPSSTTTAWTRVALASVRG